MHLIEKDGFFTLPIFAATNIADMLRSRNRVLATLDTTFNEHFQTLRSSKFRGKLPDNFPRYNQAIELLLLGINHQVERDDINGSGIRLYDSSGEVFVKLLPSPIRLIERIRNPQWYRDFNNAINTTWIQRAVWLRVSYYHDPKISHLHHNDYYMLEQVFNLPKPASVQTPTEENLPQALPAFAS